MAEVSGVITEGFTDWFRREHISSAEGRNKYLDNLAQLQADLGRPLDDPFNQRVAKVMEHLGRHIGTWWQNFNNNPTDDYFIAQQAFAAQMATTGARREQNMVQATSQRDYDRRKANENPLGIDIQHTVETRLLGRFGTLTNIDFASAGITPEELYKTARETTGYGYGMLVRLAEHSPSDKGLKKFGTVSRAVGMQTAWLNLAVDYVTYAAQIHDGDLSQAPFLHPVSISDQPKGIEAVYYPFA